MKFSLSLISAFIAMANNNDALVSAFGVKPGYLKNSRVSSSASPSLTQQHATNPEKSVFLTPELAKACVDAVGTPTYAYSLTGLRDAAEKCLAFPNAYGLTVRYAMKASPNRAILQLFNKMGICIDASSGYEVSYLKHCV